MENTNDNKIEEFKNSLTKYTEIISTEKKSQEANKILLSNYISKLENYAQDKLQEETIHVVFEDLKQTYNFVLQNLTYLEDLSTILENSKSSTDTTQLENYTFECLKKYQIIQQNNQAINSFLTNILEFIDFDFSNNKSSINETENEEISFDENDYYNTLEENTLIVNEKKKKCYLPFTKQEVDNILEKNSKYTNCNEIIQDKYIRNLNYYRNPTVSRFKECYHLIKDKCNGGVMEALKLALDNIFNYKLNPIIISACRNKDELDIYLDCLEENQLSDFKCFKIIFEVAPALKNKHLRK